MSINIGDLQGTVLDLVAHTLTPTESPDIRVVIGCLTLLVVWLHDSPKVVTAFLSEGNNLQFVSRVFSYF